MAEQLGNPNDTFLIDEQTPDKLKKERAHIINSKAFDPKTYEFDESYKEPTTVDEVHTVKDLLRFVENGEAAIDARVLVANETGRMGVKKITQEQFVEAHKGKRIQFKEAGVDAFLTDGYGQYGNAYGGNGLVGQDFVPLLGGPFFKQLYITDYLKMISSCFYAYNHDPFARAIVQITRDFTLGRGWRADSDNKAALAIWEAFCEANDLYEMMDHFAIELSIYGESMVWWLPENETKITYNLSPGQEVPKGVIPRVRLIDPSCIWDICTYPEDISRVLFYQWVAPSQWQTYTNDQKTGERVPGSKFIYQQVPADQVMHFKVNSVSNEKRGRSDLYPVLGYLKRLRDSVNYGIVGMQKNMAWSIDTSIDGSQADIDAYVESQQALGTIPPAGSEFVHSKKVERKYIANEGAKGMNSQMFEWCLSCIAAGTGIPTNYFGTHLNTGSTRASALVATEPVTKKFEKRRLVYEQVLKKLSRRVLNHFGIKNADIEFSFPELVSQDRSSKLKDMALVSTMGWIKEDRLAAIAAKELDITDFDPAQDMGIPEAPEPGLPSNPLSLPSTKPEPTAPTNEMRRDERNNG